MAHEIKTGTEGPRVKTFRWLFYMNLTQLLIFFAVLLCAFPRKHVLDMTVLASLTVGTVFATFSLLVSMYGFIVDRMRKRLYLTMIILMVAWLIWAAVTWLYIEHMAYLLR